MNSVNDRSRDIGPFVPGPDDDMLICRCEEITKGEIRKAVHEGMWTMTEIRRYLRTEWDCARGRHVPSLSRESLQGSLEYHRRSLSRLHPERLCVL